MRICKLMILTDNVQFMERDGRRRKTEMEKKENKEKYLVSGGDEHRRKRHISWKMKNCCVTGRKDENRRLYKRSSWT